MVLKLKPSNISSSRPRNQNQWNGSAAVAHVKVRKSRRFSHDNRTYLDIPWYTSLDQRANRLLMLFEVLCIPQQFGYGVQP